MPTAHNLFRRVLPALAMAALWVAPTPAAAANNNQTGLVNVAVTNLLLQAPVSVAVPVSVAANVCQVDVAILAAQRPGLVRCDARSTSFALNEAIANAMTSGSGGGGSNNQSGLVNVYLSNITVQLPVSVNVPIGVAANVCGINAAVLAAQSTSPVTCSSAGTSTAFSRAIAAQMP